MFGGGLAICAVCCIIYACKNGLDSMYCGPGALSASFAAVKSVPKNTAVGDDSGGFGFAVGTSQTNTARGRILVHTTICFCCLSCFGLIAFAVVLASTEVMT